METKIVYNTKLASRLCQQGFIIVKTVPNPQKPWLTSYLFEETEELLNALEREIQQMKTD